MNFVWIWNKHTEYQCFYSPTQNWPLNTIEHAYSTVQHEYYLLALLMEKRLYYLVSLLMAEGVLEEAEL